jgi:hypothetical protein
MGLLKHREVKQLAQGLTAVRGRGRRVETYLEPTLFMAVRKLLIVSFFTLVCYTLPSPGIARLQPLFCKAKSCSSLENLRVGPALYS